MKHREVGRDQVEQQRGDGEERPPTRQRPPPEAIRRPADDRAEQQRRDGEGADRDADARASPPPSGPVDEPRRDRQDDPARDVEGERRGRQRDERPREEACVGVGPGRSDRCRAQSACRLDERRPSSRSAAAYGSRRCSATSSSSARGRAARGAAIVQPRPQPLAEDRPDLGLGPGQAGRRRPAVARPPPGAGRAPRAARARPSPVAAVVIRTSGRFGSRALGGVPAAVGARRDGDEHRPQLRGGPLRAGLVALVDDDEVGHLEQAGLDRLDLVAHLGRLEHDRRVRRGRDLDLALAGADRLDEDEVEAGGVEDGCRGRRRRREPAGMAARRHRADEDVAVVRRRPASGPGRRAARRR